VNCDVVLFVPFTDVRILSQVNIKLQMSDVSWGGDASIKALVPECFSEIFVCD
jgi:hypothetical protein